MLTILGRNNSINVQKVMWTCSEIGCQTERRDIGGEFGGNNTPEYLKKNPTGQIPTLIDGKYILWESNTIVRYISDTYGDTPWQPKDKKICFLGHQWMDFYIASLHPAMTTIFWQLIRTPIEKRNESAIQHAHKKATILWGLVNEHLRKNSFILGPHVTFSDVPMGCAVYRWYNLDIKRANYYHLESWYDRLSKRHPYQENVMLPLT
ncbi:MAG: Glutathione S-transferase GstB [Alphaproteobacteria bacterium MarineAlpha3_Bin5]|nr:MAG: Glutathione S-transferase GstB [Alphaproteobacteria bacterium MarineAlpha3_Bin5]